MKYGVMFHHFHDDNLYPSAKNSGSISATDFHSIIDYIEENYNLISPNEFTKKISNKTINDSDVCLTFDDSLKCQFDIAYPELKKRKLKAFFFVYSSLFSNKPPLLEFIRDFKLFYFKNIDEYYDCFFETIRLNYNLQYNSLLREFKDDYLSSYVFYTLNDKKYRFLRDEILKDIYFEVLIGLMELKNYSIENRKSALFMTIENIKTLSNDGNIIGLHSHNHSTSFDQLSYKEQLKEYTLNYDFLTSVTNKKITSMSHPLGKYNDDTLRILKKLGITIGFRDSLFPSNILSNLEIPREDHSNVLRLIKSKQK